MKKIFILTGEPSGDKLASTAISKIQKDNNDIFFNPIDIGDNTIPNGNAMMLINLVRLGMMKEAKILSDSLNGYLNIYKNYGQKVLNILENHEIRAHLDDRNETVGKKIRESEINVDNVLFRGYTMATMEVYRGDD